MKRLPKAVIKTKQLRTSQLIPYCQSFKTKLLAEVATFPTPPVSTTALQTLIDNYQAAYVAAIKGTIAQTAAKHDAKTALIQGMRADVTYVNQIVQSMYEADPNVNYATLQNTILSVIPDSKNVTRPNSNGNSGVAVTISTLARQRLASLGNVNGVLKVRVRATKKFGSASVKTYMIRYRTAGTTPGPWVTELSTTSRIQITGLTKGIYDYQIAPVIGVFKGQEQLNFTAIQQTIVT